MTYQVLGGAGQVPAGLGDLMEPPDDGEWPGPLGGWTQADLDTSSHEAGHAVAAVLLGMPLRGARIDRPDVGLAGLTELLEPAAAAITKRWFKRYLAVVLAGPMTVGEELPYPPWSDGREGGEHGDFEKAALVQWVLGLDLLAWLEVVTKVEALIGTRTFRLATREVAVALVEKGFATRDEIEEAVQAAMSSAMAQGSSARGATGCRTIPWSMSALSILEPTSS